MYFPPLRSFSAAVIYQSYNLFPLLTAEENVMYPLKLKKMPASDAKEICHKQLAAVGIQPDQFKRFPSQLSGGEQQRVAWRPATRSFWQTSPPVTWTSPTANRWWRSSCGWPTAHQEGRCVIIVTHDLEIASQMDEIFTMRDGVLKRDL